MAREPSPIQADAVRRSKSTVLSQSRIDPLVCAEEDWLRGRSVLELRPQSSLLAARAAYVKFRGPTEGHKGLLWAGRSTTDPDRPASVSVGVCGAVTA